MSVPNNRDELSNRTNDCDDTQAQLEWTRHLIRCKVRTMVGRARLQQTDAEDLEQELYQRVLEGAPSFDRTRGDWHPFAATIIRRAASKMMRHRMAAKRNPYRVCSLNEPIDPREEAEELSKSISNNELNARLGKTGPTDQDLAEMGHDIESVLSELTEHERQLCELLKTCSVSEAARQLDVPRTTLQDQIRAIRESFKSRGYDKTSH